MDSVNQLPGESGEASPDSASQATKFPEEASQGELQILMALWSSEDKALRLGEITDLVGDQRAQSNKQRPKPAAVATLIQRMMAKRLVTKVSDSPPAIAGAPMAREAPRYLPAHKRKQYLLGRLQCFLEQAQALGENKQTLLDAARSQPPQQQPPQPKHGTE